MNDSLSIIIPFEIGLGVERGSRWLNFKALKSRHGHGTPFMLTGGYLDGK